MDYVVVSDLTRYGCVVGSLLCAAVMLRGAYLRVHRHGWRGTESPHPASILAVSIGLTLGCFRRFENLGEPGDWFLWGYVVVLGLLMFGLSRTTQFTLTPPWRRH